MKEFLLQSKQYGIKIALGNQLITFCKWYTGAKRIQLTYTTKKIYGSK